MIISVIVDIAVGFFINILSQTPFKLSDTKNLIILTVFIILVFILILCNICIHYYQPNVETRKLQKAFQKSGGYEVVTEEIKYCIKNGDIKKLKEL